MNILELPIYKFCVARVNVCKRVLFTPARVGIFIGGVNYLPLPLFTGNLFCSRNHYGDVMRAS